MKRGSLYINPTARVMIFFLGIVSAFVTLKHINEGVTRYGGVENTRVNEPFAYWFVVATMIYLTVLLFCAAFVRNKTDA